MSLYLEEFKASEMYKVRFIHPKVGMVEGWLKAPPSVTTASQWSDMANQRFGGGMMDTGAQAGFGRSMTMGQFTVQKWQGPQPVVVNFHIAYVAINDAFEEVVKPVRELLKFPLPPEFSPAMLKPPVDAMQNEFCFVFGKWFAIPKLLPASVNPEWSHTLDKTGHPISATVELSFNCSQAVSMQDIDGWFF